MLKTPPKQKKWLLPISNPKLQQSIEQDLSCTQVLSQILVHRGFSDLQKIRSFLNPTWDDSYDPYLLKDMDKAVERIKIALEKQEGVLIHGDYDVDGVSSASLLVFGLQKLGFNQIEYFLPNRMVDGYGVSRTAFEKAKANGCKLLITCDCGITALEAMDWATELELDVIITDHHEPKETLPQVLAVINPKRKDCKYPFKEIAGVGVAFKLLQALGVHEDLTDLLTLGTIADVVPLEDENRMFVKQGLPALQNTKKPGLQSLLHVCGLKDKAFGSGHVGFQVAPRINAVGRLGDPTDGLRMLVSDDYDWAYTIAEKLDADNQTRKNIEQAILDGAHQMIEDHPEYEADPVLVLYQEDWHQGVIGIVASRMVDAYHKAAIIIAAPEDGLCKASCRSIPALSILAALDVCKEHLGHYGGHAYAAGFSIPEENIDAFRTAINAHAKDILSEDDLKPKLQLDAICEADHLNWDVFHELEQLAPFGAGHVTPVLAAKGFYLKEAPRMLNDKHLRLQVTMDGLSTVMTAMAFGQAHHYDKLSYAYSAGRAIHFAFQLQRNEWQGRVSLQMNVVDVKVG